MKFTFDPSSRLIRVRVELSGVYGKHEAWFALDTASTRTCVSVLTLRRMGIDTRGIAQKGKAHGVTMDGSFGMIPLLRLKAIGETWDNPTVAFIELNAASKIHGLLGLDFLRGRILTVDFRRGTVSLKQPSPWRFWRRLR